jgi:biopolymer transport protein ExbD/biopolymer transport protein TolR
MVQVSAKPNSEINVTPLVDVVLVLLIIFMVLTPLLEKDIEIKVPQTEEVETTAEVPPDQLVVGVSAKGEITINNQPVKLEDYPNEIKKLLDPKAEKDRLVFFMADDEANYGTTVTILDKTKLAGAITLGMMTQIPEAVATPPGVDPTTTGTGGAPLAPAAPDAPAAPPAPQQ